jgi:hypothetical protein
MQSASSGNGNAPTVRGHSDEARNAVNAAFAAISNWRAETIGNSEKNIRKVIERMAAAGRTLGWPERAVEMTREQMQAVTRMQIQAMDYIMAAWEEQIKSPDPSALLSKLKSLPSLGDVPSSASADQGNLLKPYIQMSEQWQKLWGNAISFWARAWHFPHW